MTNIVKTLVLPNAPKQTVSRIVDKSRFMKRAHALARTYTGHYHARMSLAMRNLYASIGGPKLVATYKPVFDKHGICHERISIQQEDKTWLHTVVDHELTYLGNKNSETPKRYNRSRALSNGVMHIEHEYNKCFNELTHVISMALSDHPKADIAKVKAKSLQVKCERLLADLKDAKAYEPVKVKCEIPRNKRIDTQARKFSDILWGTYEELDKRYAI